MSDTHLALPTGFQSHFRKSPATQPWEPLFSRVNIASVDLLFDVREAHCNARNFLHGGVLAALCDNSMGLSLGVTLNNPKASIVTISLSLDFLGSAKMDDRVLIEPRVLRAGQSIGYCDALVRVADTCIARASATFSVRVTEHNHSARSK